MNPEDRPGGPPQTEPTPKGPLIQFAARYSLDSYKQTATWDGQVLEQLAADYEASLILLDSMCGGRWRNLNIIKEQRDNGEKRTFVTLGEDLQNRLLKVEDLANKEYLSGIPNAVASIRHTFVNAFHMVVENKSPEQLTRLKNLSPSRSGVKDASTGQRHTHGNHSAG